MSGDIPIIIYQMGKVGSTALYQALKKTGRTVYQVHSLNKRKVAKTKRILMSKGLGIPRHVEVSEKLIAAHIDNDHPAYVITPIRSPLERNISAFFQELSTEVILKDSLRKKLGISSFVTFLTKFPIPNEWKNALIYRFIYKHIEDKTSILIEHFKESYRHTIPLQWFDDELQPALNIDVYDFIKEESFSCQTFHKNNLKLLVLKSELSDDIKSERISSFLDIDLFPIERKHQSNKKMYDRLLSDFRSQLALDDSLIEQYASSKYSRIFYPASM